MSVEVRGNSVVVRNQAMETKFGGGLQQALAGAHARLVAIDEHLTAVAFDDPYERSAWVDRLHAHGVVETDVVVFETPSPAVRPSWLSFEALNEELAVAWLEGADRGTPVTPSRPVFKRHEILSRSDSGLHYVRDSRSGRVRVLTEEELQDLNDPVPCDQCGEQFGCDHYNCAGEELLTDSEIEAGVPEKWKPIARGVGISRNDLTRLAALVEDDEGEYQIAPGTETDMRALELVLILNGDE